MTTPPDDVPQSLAQIGDTVEPDPDDGGQSDGSGRADDCPVTTLGHNGAHYKFLTPTGELLDLTAGALVGTAGLLSLFNGETDWLVANHPRRDAKDKVVGFSVQSAGADLIRRCVAAGMLDAETRICGRGVWSLPGGEFVVHCGDALLIKSAWSKDPEASPRKDARWQPPGRLGQTIFQARAAIARPAQVAATAAEMQGLREDIAQWRFQAESAAEVLLGFIGQACLGGALSWRAHLVVSGNTGAGKTLLNDLVSGALGGLAFLTNDFTAAALRQLLTTEARVLMLDEAESDPKRGRVRQVVELLRAMSSGTGARAIRGSAEGIASSYTLAGSAYLSAIVPPGLKPQDQGRITHIELLPIEAGADDAEARAAVQRASELSPRLWARMIQGWPRFKANLAVWRQALMQHGCGPRQADQPAHLLAAYWTLVDDAVVSEQIARSELPRYEWMITTASDAAANDGATRCWNHLLGMVDPSRGGEQRTIGQLIRMARTGESHDLRRLLQSYGIRLDPPKGHERASGAWVSNDSPMLKRLFANTEWEDGGWPYELRRLPDCHPWKHPVRIGESKSRATFVHERHLPGSDDESANEQDNNQVEQ